MAFTQLCDNCPCDYTQSWICEANAHWNHLLRWFTDANWNAHRRQCASERERSNPHQMCITGTVWTGLNLWYKGFRHPCAVTCFLHLSPLFQSCTLSLTPTHTLTHINYRRTLHTYLSQSTNPSSSMVGMVVSGLIFLSSSHLRCSPKKRPHCQVAGTANVASQ